MIFLRWMFWRVLRWQLVAFAAIAGLMLMVDWVEEGAALAREGAGGGQALLLASLLLPGRLIQAAPLAAAAGAALASLELRRTQEWQALAAAGISPVKRLAPFLVAGLLVGVSTLVSNETVVLTAASTYSRRLSTLVGGGIRDGQVAWLSSGRHIFRISDPAGESLGAVTVWTLDDGMLVSMAWASGLEWTGSRWEPMDASQQQETPWHGVPDGFPFLAKWQALPSPDDLAAELGTDRLASRSWTSLKKDPRPSADAELVGRWSRALGCVAAVLLGAAVPLAWGARAWLVMAAVAPVFSWELLAAVAQVVAGQGLVPAWTVALARLLVAGLATAMVCYLLYRPGHAG